MLSINESSMWSTKKCWVIDEIVVLWYAMFSWILIFELKNGMWYFDVVTLRWCLGLGSGIGHNSCIAPSVIRGLLGGLKTWGKI